MDLNIICPDCSAKMRAPSELAGQIVGCSKCTAEFVLPKTSGPGIPLPAAPAPTPPAPVLPKPTFLTPPSTPTFNRDHDRHIASARGIASVLDVVAVLCLIFTVIGIVALLILASVQELPLSTMILPVLFTLIGGGIGYGIFRASAEILQLLADISENTRP